MQHLQWDDLDEQIVNDACTLANADEALAKIFAVIDPANREDLGGEAGHFFSGSDLNTWWHMSAGFAQRRKRLDEFLNYLFAISIEEWHDEYVMRQAVGA